MRAVNSGESYLAAPHSLLPVLETPRLVLKALTIEDVEPAHRLWTEPGVRRYLWDDESITPGRDRLPLSGSEADFERQGFGLWGVCCHGESRLIGFCGLRQADLVPQPELLFGLTESEWGKGLACEAATTVLHFGFDRLRLPEIGAATDQPNQASVRLLERLGFSPVGQTRIAGRETLLFRLAEPDWRRLQLPSR